MIDGSKIDPNFFFDLTGPDGRPALSVADEGDPGVLTLQFRNQTSHVLRFQIPPDGQAPGPDWFHFSLSLRPGVLSETTLSMLAGPDAAEALLGDQAEYWTIACPDPAPGAPVTIYFNLNGHHSSALWLITREGSGNARTPPIMLSGISAQPALAGQGTRVQLKFWAIAPEDQPGRFTPRDMTRRMAISYPRTGGLDGPPLSLILTSPLAIPVCTMDLRHEAECHFMLRNTSDSETIPAGDLHLSVRIASSADPFALGPPGGMAEAASLCTIKPNGGTVTTGREAQGGAEASSRFRWRIPLPPDGLPPGGALRLKANLPSESEELLDITIDYDLKGFGAGRRVYSFMRSKAANIKRAYDELRTLLDATEKNLKDLIQQSGKKLDTLRREIPGAVVESAALKLSIPSPVRIGAWPENELAVRHSPTDQSWNKIHDSAIHVSQNYVLTSGDGTVHRIDPHGLGRALPKPDYPGVAFVEVGEFAGHPMLVAEDGQIFFYNSAQTEGWWKTNLPERYICAGEGFAAKEINARVAHDRQLSRLEVFSYSQDKSGSRWTGGSLNAEELPIKRIGGTLGRRLYVDFDGNVYSNEPPSRDWHLVLAGAATDINAHGVILSKKTTPSGNFRIFRFEKDPTETKDVGYWAELGGGGMRIGGTWRNPLVVNNLGVLYRYESARHAG